jgi:hypothetical protein
MESAPFPRQLAGFVIGAAVADAFTLVSFLQLSPPSEGPNHTTAVMMTLLIFMFFSGGFLGRRVFIGASRSKLLRPVIGTYVVLLFLGLMSGDWRETAIMTGLVSVGMLCSVVTTLLLCGCFP